MFARKFRVDDPEDKYRDQMKQFVATFSQHLLVQEREPKIHYHGYFISDKTTSAHRQQLQKLCPIAKGNKGHSFAENHHDWPFYIGYCLKQPTTEIISHQGLEHDLDHYKEYYLEEKNAQEDRRNKRRE